MFLCRPIKLVVAKCWEQTPSRGYLSMPRQEPVRPIDPGAWVAHTAAVRGKTRIHYPTRTVNGVWEFILRICFGNYTNLNINLTKLTHSIYIMVTSYSEIMACA